QRMHSPSLATEIKLKPSGVNATASGDPLSLLSEARLFPSLLENRRTSFAGPLSSPATATAKIEPSGEYATLLMQSPIWTRYFIFVSADAESAKIAEPRHARICGQVRIPFMTFSPKSRETILTTSV